MAWEVEFTDEFGAWWATLSEEQQDDVAVSVGLISELGPALGYPLAWYEQFVPVADRPYSQHLEELRKEGKL